MAADLSSAVSTQSPPSIVVKGGGVPHNTLVRPASASAVNWQVQPKLQKLHLSHRPRPIPSLISPANEDAPGLDDTAEPASHFFILRDPAKDTLLSLCSPHLSSPLFFFSHSFRQQKQESSERDDFYANMGSAIRTIREETPYLFYKDLNYSIYRDDITFRDPRNTFTGIDKYKLIFWALRFHGQMFFKAIWVEVLRIWQPSDRVIVVRWTVRGIPRVPWEAQGLFEGTSEYKLDENGRIYEHKVDNVAPSNPSYLKTLTLLDLLPSTPRATPTLTYFRRAVLPSLIKLIASESSTWERFYFALTATLDMQASTPWLVWYLAS